jgi:tetratricopeptide (TPR) repeat protein
MSTRCAVCGVESTLDRVFRRQATGRGRFPLVCPACRRRERNSSRVFALITAVVIAIVGTCLIWSDSKQVVGHNLVFFGFILLTQVFCILPHEYGHVFAAFISGIRVFTVNIGNRGRILFVWRLLGHDLVVRSIPLGGHTLVALKSIVFARLRRFVVVLGGPLANLLLIAATIPLWAQFTAESAIYWMFAGFIWGNALVIARNLFPRTFSTGTRMIQSDGLKLLRIPFASNNKVREWHAGWFYLEALEAAERGRLQDAEKWFAKWLQANPENSPSPHSKSYALSQLQRHSEAREIYLGLLAKSETDPEIMAVLHAVIAWTDLMLGDPALLHQADQFSKQAIEALPWDPYTKGIRGSLLVELGDFEEAIQMLTQTMKENDLPSAKALNACYLAIAMMRTGHRQRANEYVEEAKRNDPFCPLLQRTIKELEGTSLVG